ncbi:MAG: RHS repeat protein [Spirochaetes bacterium]|nr:RHS repeat protein [Spirochaetota bacterium]
MIYINFHQYVYICLLYGLTKVAYPDGKYVQYGYDQYYRLTSVQTPYGTDTYSYDELNRPVKVVDKNGYATIYSYDANGNRSEVKYANGITVTYSYDELNRLTEEKAVDKNGICVASYKYSLGKSGERIRAEELDRTVEYTYD